MTQIDYPSGRIRLVTPHPGLYEAWRDAHAGSAPPMSPTNAPPRPPEERSREHYDALLDRLEWLRSNGNHGLTILRQSDGVQLGVLSLFDRVDGHSKSIFMGYNLFNQHWGQGYATEAVRAGLCVAFETLELHRVEALTEVNNQASIRVLERCGFRREGLAKRRIHQRGEWQDTFIYALTAEEHGDLGDVAQGSA